MSPRPTAPAAPACMDDLLAVLRQLRLLDQGQSQRLASGWPGDLSAAAAAERLVEAGLLTAFQAEQVLAGRARRLRLGPYRLLDRLGGGRVFKAEHVLLKRLVTLKVLGRARPRAGRRDEVRIAGGLAHPNLVSALHAGRLRGRLVLVLEYVEGIDLEQFVAGAGPLPAALAWEVLRQSAQALAHLHERGLVHRDVKPANLILSHTGPGGAPVVKLIDLGLACRAGSSAGPLCGTVDYLAPERGSGEPADIRSDLYSLGCTLYHLLAGQVPHPGGSWTDKLLRHRTEQPPSLVELRPDLPPALASIVARLMAPDPIDRFADPAALLAVLDRLPSRGPAARAHTRARRPTVRRRLPGLLRLLAAILGGLLLGGLARLGWSASLAVAPAGPAAAPPRITVSGREEEFTDLEKAIAAAPAEATLVLHGRGPYRLRPTQWRGRSLTLRGEGAPRPCLERIDAAGLQWEALLAGEGELVLQGLHLHGGDNADRVAPLVTAAGGRLTLCDCTLTGRSAGPLVSLRRGKGLRLEHCTIDARAQAVAVEQSPEQGLDLVLRDCQVHVRDVAGAALLVWAGEPRPAPAGRVEMRRCRFEAGRILACRALGSKLDVAARDCRFVFHQALLSLDACPDRHDPRRRLSWREEGNTYTATGAWFRLDGRPAAWDEAAWKKLW